MARAPAAPPSSVEVRNSIPDQLHRDGEQQEAENSIDRPGRSRPETFHQRASGTKKHIGDGVGYFRSE